ncbi:ATP-grasp domain-containing protein [Paenibacillus sp. M1]|uniref:ATP-grasp domain-containing protein n=1 Tax=Paenibacillus haidiansis TaxID=1574488 RepID=A0ABU7VS70_9BACL
MSEDEAKAVFLLEPCFFGEKYVESAAALELVVIVIRREHGPEVRNKELVNYELICDITDAQTTYQKIDEFFQTHPYISRNSGILPGHDYAVPVAAEIATKFGWNTNSVQTADCARSKVGMRRQLSNSRYISNPGYRLFENLTALMDELDQIKYPAIVKPVNMTSSMFVKFVQNPEELVSHAQKIVTNEDNFGYPSGSSFLVEEYIQGQEYSFEAFMSDGKCKLAQITEKIKTPLPYFVELQHTLPAPIEPAKYEDILNRLIHLMGELGISEGPCHLEFVLSSGRIYVIEYSTRLPGGRITDLYRLAYGVDLHKAAILNALGEESQRYLNPIYNNISRIRHFHRESGRIKQIIGMEEAKKLPEVIEIVVEKHENEFIPAEMISNMDRYGFFLLKASTYEAVERVSSQLEGIIEFVMENEEAAHEQQKC